MISPVVPVLCVSSGTSFTIKIGTEDVKIRSLFVWAHTDGKLEVELVFPPDTWPVARDWGHLTHRLVTADGHDWTRLITVRVGDAEARMWHCSPKEIMQGECRILCNMTSYELKPLVGSAKEG